MHFSSVSDYSLDSMEGDEPTGSRFRELSSSSGECFRSHSRSHSGSSRSWSRSPSRTRYRSRGCSRSRRGSGGSDAAVEEAKLLLEANVIKFCDTHKLDLLLLVQPIDWSPGL